jgi:hypothetical protein
MGEIGRWRTPLVTADIWTLICRAQLVEGGEAWLSAWLWRYRYATWVAAQTEESCEACGGSLKGRTAAARFCGAACEQRARRARSKGRRTVHQLRVERGVADARALDRQLARWRRWVQGLDAFVFPLDLLRVDNLPSLPGRCGGGCHERATCGHTGRACLFAGTTSAR